MLFSQEVMDDEKRPMIANEEVTEQHHGTNAEYNIPGLPLPRSQLQTFRERCHALFSFKSLLSFLYELSIFLLPSFIVNRFVPQNETKVHATAWLDGLRGWAALFVFFHHTSYLFFNHDLSWGYDGGNREWWRFPIFRVIYCGHTAVTVFFVVSGFTLSIRPLKQMRTGAHGELLATLSSATLRRPIRLYGPLVTGTFLVFLLGRTPIFEYNKHFMPGFLGWEGHHYQRQSSDPLSDIWTWARTTVNFCMAQIYHWSTPIASQYVYDAHVWTIPVEYRCSLGLYLTQLALARVRSRIRMLTLLGFMVLAAFQDWWALMLFWSGMLLCELHTKYSASSLRSVALPAHNSPISTQKRSWRISPYVIAALHVINATCALFLLSIPERGCTNSPGYKTLCKWSPPAMGQFESTKFRFWAGIGAMQLVAGTAAAAVSPPLGRLSLSALLSAPLSRYLGNISYALYCVHGLTNHTIGIPVWYAVFQVTGGGKGWTIGYMICMGFQTIFTVWVADIFWRLADKPSVVLARKVEEIVLRKHG